MHGRLSSWNGNPTSTEYRVIGTNSIIGIREETSLPKDLNDLLSSFDDEIFGDFTVCPLTIKRKGVMQIVCVQSAENLYKKHN